MTLRSYLWSVRLSTLILFVALGFVVTSIDPQTAGAFGFGLFYASFFLSFSGLFILLFTWLWRGIGEEGLTVGELGMSFRQGTLTSLLLSILLFFQHMKILVWWDTLLVIAGILLIELYFLSRAPKS